MNLKKKKQLAARSLGVGKERITFVKSRLDEIKEAITKQDIRELHSEGAIIIKNIKGRRKVIKRKSKKGEGKIKIRIKRRKEEYVKITRKLRAYIKELKKQKKISKEQIEDLRKKIRNRKFNSLSSLKAYLKASGAISNTENESAKTNNRKNKISKTSDRRKKI